ncbi:hypothetical protein [Paraburkholderia oxyphila]|uniref:hypothetical protein n=1 Tax=Paraburkholderia oxyphila TaxID=614212 RepID=UPI0005B8ED96|nr:hypothetical protein [Paraburkholderia oxyphila]
MNDKFTIEVTINPLVSPLLHERLGRCISARERAAVLRLLAEAMLLREMMRQESISHPAPVSPAPESAQTPRLTTNEANVTESFVTLSVGSAADIGLDFSSDLGSQLAYYFD